MKGWQKKSIELKKERNNAEEQALQILNYAVPWSGREHRSYFQKISQRESDNVRLRTRARSSQAF